MSALQHRHRDDLVEAILDRLPPPWPDEPDEVDLPEMKLAMVGRRNVGKSTFVNVVAQLLACQRVQFLEAVRCGDDGRAGIEGEAVVLIDVAAAAGLVACLEEDGGNAGRLQTDGQGEAAEAGADDGNTMGGRGSL